MAISINLVNASATTNSVTFSLIQPSACFVLSSSQGVEIDGTITFQNLSITQTEISFSVSPGDTFDGELTLNLEPSQPNGVPIILIDGLDFDAATVTYPTNDGPETQALTAGQQLVLSGFVVD